MGQAKSNPVSDHEIDRKLLKQLQSRFLELNEKRTTLLHQNTTEQEQIFVQLIPFLFHINHPTLPGYVQSTTPCGVCHYKPNKQTINLAKRYSRSLEYKPDLAMLPAIEGLYLMGSAGSVAHTGQSDLDVWVCYRSDLSESDLKQLRKKRDHIQTWATSVGIDVSIYLVTPGRILDGSAESEKGTAQSALLLDEFYRTQIYLAGKLLMWWLIPVEWDHEYESYKQRLIQHKYIQPDHWIDFGQVDAIPLEEYIGNALWYINKALTSPYKTALKLVLMEAYLSQYPDVIPLSQDYKSFVYNLMDNATVVDSYLLMHRKVEEYLILNGQMDRLEFVRRCLYQKIQIRLSVNPRKVSQSRAIIQQLVDEWGWTKEKQKLFDGRNNWDINQIGNEKRLYVKQLISSFRTIGEFIKKQQKVFEQYKPMLLCLSRKISAYLELTQGKIELVNINFVPHMSDRHLSLVRQTKAKDMQLWSFYDRAISHTESQTSEPVYQCGSLLELLVWAKLNGLVNEGTALQYRDVMQQLQYDELEQLVRVLVNNTYGQEVLDDSTYLNAPKIHEISCFINVAHDRLTTIAKQGVHVITNRNDPLSYGGERYNLIETIDLFYSNTWGELFVVSFCGEDALSEAAIALLELSERQGLIPVIKYHSFSSMRAENTVNRVRGFYTHLLELFQSQHAESIKYIYRLGVEFRAIYKNDGAFTFTRAEDNAAISEIMVNSKTNVSYCSEHQHLELDPYCFPDPVIVTALQKADKTDPIMVINSLNEARVSACFVDRRGGAKYLEFDVSSVDLCIERLVYFICKSSGDESFRAELKCFQLQQNHAVTPWQFIEGKQGKTTEMEIVSDRLIDPKVMTMTLKNKSLKVDEMELVSTKFSGWLDRAWQFSPEQVHISRLTIEDTDFEVNYSELLLQRERLAQLLEVVE